MPSRLPLLATLALCAACTKAPSAQETLPKLRAAIQSPVDSAEQNAQNSTLVDLVSSEKQLHGLTRSEVEQQLGRGDPCSRHPVCGERGFFGEDWHYEIGQLGGGYVRARPELIVGFNRFGKVERTFVLRAQPK